MAGIPLSFSIWLWSITKISGFSIPELSFIVKFIKLYEYNLIRCSLCCGSYIVYGNCCPCCSPWAVAGTCCPG